MKYALKTAIVCAALAPLAFAAPADARLTMNGGGINAISLNGGGENGRDVNGRDVNGGGVNGVEGQGTGLQGTQATGAVSVEIRGFEIQAIALPHQMRIEMVQE